MTYALQLYNNVFSKKVPRMGGLFQFLFYLFFSYIYADIVFAVFDDAERNGIAFVNAEVFVRFIQEFSDDMVFCHIHASHPAYFDAFLAFLHEEDAEIVGEIGMAEFIYGIHGSEEFQTFIFEIAFVDEPDRFLKRRRIDIGMKDDIPVSGAAPADLQGNRSVIRKRNEPVPFPLRRSEDFKREACFVINIAIPQSTIGPIGADLRSFK